MIEISENVFEALKACRDSGEHNIFDRDGVLNWCINNGYRTAALWMYENKKLYGQVLIEFGKLSRD